MAGEKSPLKRNNPDLDTQHNHNDIDNSDKDETMSKLTRKLYVHFEAQEGQSFTSALVVQQDATLQSLLDEAEEVVHALVSDLPRHVFNIPG